MRLFLSTAKRIMKPKRKMTDLEAVRDYLRYVRDYNLPEELVEEIMDVCIKLLIDVETEHSGGIPVEEFTKDDLKKRTKEQSDKFREALSVLLEEPDNV